MDLFSYLLGKKAGLKKATKVIANPELAGTEDDLTGLQVGDTKYKIDVPKTTWGQFSNTGSSRIDITSTHNYQQLPIAVTSQKDDIFEVTSNSIKVKKNLTDILVSVKVAVLCQSTSESRFFRIEKTHNGVSGDIGMTETYCQGNQTTCIIIPFAISNLEIGDELKIYLYGQSGDRIYTGAIQANIFAYYNE